MLVNTEQVEIRQLVALSMEVVEFKYAHLPLTAKINTAIATPIITQAAYSYPSTYSFIKEVLC